MSGSVSSGAYVYWVSKADGFVPENAVFGGIEPTSGKLFYIGRTKVKGHLIPGMIVPNDRCMYVTWDGREQVFKSYEVMVKTWNARGLHWLPREKGQSSANAVQGGQTKHGDPLYIARVRLPQGGAWTGPFKQSMNGCRVIYKGREEEFEEYDLLCHRSKHQNQSYMFKPARDSPTIRDIIRTLKSNNDKQVKRPTWLI